MLTKIDLHYYARFVNSNNRNNNNRIIFALL